MKIAVICASGKQGTCLVKEAMGRGHEVSAVVRDRKKLTASATKVIEKDLFNLRYEDVADCPVVIDAFGTWAPETLPLYKTSLKYLADLLSGKPNRLLVVGGAGSLYVNPEKTVQLVDTADFPEQFKPLAKSMAESLDELRKREDVKWTFLSPAIQFNADGERTGKYIAGGEILHFNKKGESQISYADYAIAMIDEAENAKHQKERFSVISD
jgi:uncharacterized protein